MPEPEEIRSNHNDFHKYIFVEVSMKNLLLCIQQFIKFPWFAFPVGGLYFFNIKVVGFEKHV